MNTKILALIILLIAEACGFFLAGYKLGYHERPVVVIATGPTQRKYDSLFNAFRNFQNEREKKNDSLWTWLVECEAENAILMKKIRHEQPASKR